MSRVIQLTVDDLGRIEIPSTLQSLLGLVPGMTLVVEEGENEGLRLRAQPQSSVLVKKRGLTIAKVQPLTDLTNITRFEREARIAELLEQTGA